MHYVFTSFIDNCEGCSLCLGPGRSSISCLELLRGGLTIMTHEGISSGGTSFFSRRICTDLESYWQHSKVDCSGILPFFCIFHWASSFSKIF